MPILGYILPSRLCVLCCALISEMRRQIPNILITGTPGPGKTTLMSRVMESAGVQAKVQAVSIGELVQRKQLYDGYDAEYGSHVLDEQALLAELRPLTRDPDKGLLLEYHSCDLFPREWIDAVFVLRTDNTLLYDRLTSRGYAGKKLQDNIECEIFQTILDEAHAAFDNVIQLKSDLPEDMESNSAAIQDFIMTWTPSSPPPRQSAATP